MPMLPLNSAPSMSMTFVPPSPNSALGTDIIQSADKALDAAVVISDSESSEDLSNRPLDPGDAMYRGKPGSQCVVTDTQPSPMRTRRSRVKQVASAATESLVNITRGPNGKRRLAQSDSDHVQPGQIPVSKKLKRASSIYLDTQAADDESDLTEDELSDIDGDNDSFIDDSPSLVIDNFE
ncbi:hypothetical protein CVT24_012743 [Panaeolus cyanescens]|uniref:Uncharacterized protein n=1 Tax=Panaeolus cyanescens TaxID=181874 RepID=A0A409WUI1_9AGAR|nr:hypothetical protein CVT24_012743 [Panaeolus cyanescens]